MYNLTGTGRLIPLLIITLSLLLLSGNVRAKDGKNLFQTNCAQCHNPIKVITGPALKGVTSRVTDTTLLHNWIHNNSKVLASGNPYFNNLFNRYGRAPMNVFPNLTDAEIDAILRYVESYAEPMAKTNTSTDQSVPADEDHTVLYGIVTFILAVFVFGLYLVNNNLKRLADEKKGLITPTPVPFYRNKPYIALISLLLLLLFAFGWWLTDAGIHLGRQNDYQPPWRYSRR